VTAGKGAKELLVEVVAVSENNQRWILHDRSQNDASGIKGHGQAFAGALRVPNDPDAPVASLTGCLRAG
jgi:hypothetical protein